jgi:hypothetical protein
MGDRDSFFYCIQRGQWLIAVACLLIGFTTSGFAQDAESSGSYSQSLNSSAVTNEIALPLIPANVSEPTTQSEIPPSFQNDVNVEPVDSDASVPSAYVAPPQSGYWIVSSWKSPQSFDDNRLQFCPEVTWVDDCAGKRSSSMNDLQQSLVPGVPVCIVVHGSFMDSPSVVPESLQTWRWLKAGSGGLPFQMIYFSWPSDRPLSALASIDVAVLGARASRNGFYLASLMHHLPPESPVCLLGHSHGTRVISAALHLIAGGEVEGFRHTNPNCSLRRIRTVFIASAIDHDWFNPGKRFDRALRRTECLLNLKNGKDPALMIYPFRRIGSSRALGYCGFTAKDHRELGALDRRVKDWDVSDSIGLGHLWPNYARRPWLASSLRNYFYFADEQLPVEATVANQNVSSAQ